MLRRIMISEMPRISRTMSSKGKKQSFVHGYRRGLSLPARKELQTANAEQTGRSKILASKCSYPEYEPVDYCSPLFP